MSIQGAPLFCCYFHRLTGATLAICFAAALALAGSPQLHPRVHSQADHPAHQSAVTSPPVGPCPLTHSSPPTVWPLPAMPLQTLLILTPTWVSAAFLGASIFEHAPPALS